MCHICNTYITSDAIYRSTRSPSVPARATSLSRTTAAKNSPERATDRLRPAERSTTAFCRKKKPAQSRFGRRTTKTAASTKNSDATPLFPTMIGVGEAEGGRRHRRGERRGRGRPRGIRSGGSGSSAAVSGHRTVSAAAAAAGQRRR